MQTREELKQEYKKQTFISAFEPCTLIPGILIAFLVGAVCMNIIGKMGTTPNTSLLGAIVAMLVYNIAGGTFHLSFAGQPIAHSQHLWSILGMYAVGLAATLAGGCPLRQLVLAGQGSSDAACNVLGMFVGAAIAHNFKLASSAEGTTPAGRIAVVAVVVVLLLVGLVGTRQKKD